MCNLYTVRKSIEDVAAHFAAEVPKPIEMKPDTAKGGRGIVVTLAASDVSVPPSASTNEVRGILRKAIEPVTGDAVSVIRWETASDAQGNTVWKIWARR